MGGMGGADMGNTYGLSPQFLASLNIQGPLHTRVFVANMDYTIDERKLKEVKTLVCSPIHLMFALISLLLAPCSLLLAPCSLLLAPCSLPGVPSGRPCSRSGAAEGQGGEITRVRIQFPPFEELYSQTVTDTSISHTLFAADSLWLCTTIPWRPCRQYPCSTTSSCSTGDPRYNPTF